jgi:cytoskeletal protein CcmA (bactofilin family)
MHNILGIFKKKETPMATVISKGTTVKGEFNTTDLLFVAGTILTNKIECPQLVLETPGLIEGDIVTDSIHVYGRLVGNITANEIYIHEGAVVHGDLSYIEKISIETSSAKDTVVNGNIKYMTMYPSEEEEEEKLMDSGDLEISSKDPKIKKVGRTRRTKTTVPATQELKELMSLEPIQERNINCSE